MESKKATNRFESENFSDAVLIPVAYQDNALGRTFVVKIKDTNLYAILSPPEYLLNEKTGVSEWLLDSAIMKYHFIPFINSQKEIKNGGDYSESIKAE